VNSGLNELGRKEWGYRGVSRLLLYFTVCWIQRPCLPIYRFSYQEEEENSLFYDSLRALAHVKLVWNTASSGCFGFQVPVFCCPSPLLLFLTWENGIPDMVLWDGRHGFSCLSYSWLEQLWTQLGSPVRMGLPCVRRPARVG